MAFQIQLLKLSNLSEIHKEAVVWLLSLGVRRCKSCPSDRSEAQSPSWLLWWRRWLVLKNRLFFDSSCNPVEPHSSVTQGRNIGCVRSLAQVGMVQLLVVILVVESLPRLMLVAASRIFCVRLAPTSAVFFDFLYVVVVASFLWFFLTRDEQRVATCGKGVEFNFPSNLVTKNFADFEI